METAELRQGEGTTRVSIPHLEEELRAGSLSPSASLRYPPWTSDAFLPISEIPELQEALDAPRARMVLSMRQWRWPWLTLGSTLLLTLAALLQAASSMGLLGEAWLAWPRSFATGYEAVLLEGRAWTGLSSQFVHSGPQHFLPNIAILSYTSYRLERALGASSVAVILMASVASGALAVSMLTPLPVIGSSIAGFGLFAALIVTGLRFEDSLPPEQRKSYGFGTLPLFALLFIGTLDVPNASHWGHMGGLIGGALASALLRPATRSPRSDSSRQGRLNLALAAALALLPAPLGALGARSSLLEGSWEPVELKTHGLELELPSRLREWEALQRTTPVDSYLPLRRVMGMPSWSSSLEHPEQVFAGLTELEDADSSWGADELGQQWSSRLRMELRSLEVLASGRDESQDWETLEVRLELEDAAGRTLQIEERSRRRGQWLQRSGRIGFDLTEARGQIFERVLETIRWQSPPELRDALREYEEFPEGESVRLELARQHQKLGQWQEADRLYSELMEQGERKVGEALRERLAMWARQSRHFQSPGDPPWFLSWLERTRGRGAGEAIRWSLAQERCELTRELMELHRESIALEWFEQGERDCPAAGG